MSTTSAWLQAQYHGEYAFVLAIDGYNVLFTTTDDVSGIATAWTGTDWTNVKSGLDLIGAIGQSITPLKPSINPRPLTFRVVDYSSFFLSTLLAPNLSTAGTTHLAADLDPAGVTMLVRDAFATGFSAGTNVLYVGHEQIVSGSRTDGGGDEDTFGSLTRAKNSLFTTNSGAAFKRYHRVKPVGTLNRANAPAVSTQPRTWLNTQVGLYLHHKEGSTWSTRANSLLLWAGRLKEWRDPGDGWIELDCMDVFELLNQNVLADQYRARLLEGVVLDTDISGIQIAAQSAAISGYTNTGTLANTNTRQKFGDIVSSINSQINTWYGSGAIDGRDMWSVRLQERDGARKVVFSVTPSSGSYSAGTLNSFEIGLADAIWELLGWSSSFSGGEAITDSNGHHIRLRGLRRVSGSLYELVAPLAPLIYQDPAGYSLVSVSTGNAPQVTVQDETGTWVDQTNMPARWSGLDGFLACGDNLMAVTYTAGSPGIFQVFDIPTAARDRDTGGEFINVRLDESGGGGSPEVRQTYVERGPAGQILLKLLLSTGSSGFNHSSYDVYPVGLGLGIPASLVDIQSFETLSDLEYELVCDKPRPFSEILNTICAVGGRHVVFRSGKITLTYPGFDSPSVQDIVLLTEDNKGQPDDRTRANYSASGLYNRLQLKHGTIADSTLATAFGYDRVETRSITVESTASISEHEQVKSLEIEGSGIISPEPWVEYVASPALAYFSRPSGTLTRTINPQLFHLVPGTVCKITDNTLVDPRTGTRGVAGLACFVDSVEIDFQKGYGNVSLLFMPTNAASRYSYYAPSALVSTYGTSTKVLTVSAHAFSRSTDTTTDAGRFAAGDKIAVVERSPTNPASPSRFTGEVQSVNAGANTITTTADITSGAGLTAGKTYVVEYNTITTPVQTGQRDKAFLALGGKGANPSTGLSADDAYLWSNATANDYLTFNSTVDYTTEMIRPTDRAADQGEPLSTHKLWDMGLSLSSLLNYKTRQHLLNKNIRGNATAWTASGTATWTLLTWPMLVPLYGVSENSPTIRPVHWRSRFKSNGGTNSVHVRVTCTDRKPRGSSDSGITFHGRSVSGTATTTGTSYTWCSEQTITPPVAFHQASGMAYTWMVFEGLAGAGSSSLSVKSLSMYEGVLT